MVKKIAWLGAIAGAAWLLPAWALSMGGIQVQSRLNQPLSATIPIYPSTGETIDEGVHVRLASVEDYARAGLDRLDFLSDLKFAVSGQQVLVTSNRIAREPAIDLLLEVSWGGGRLLRQYTLLLDVADANAPSVSPRPTAEELAAATAPQNANSLAPVEAYSSGNVGGTRPRRAPPGASASASSAEERPTPTRSYGPVKSNETPRSVAAKLRPDSSVSIEQVIIALFQWNPTAFGSNLSSFRPGSVLRVPDLEVIRRVDPQMAKARIAEAQSTVAEPPKPAERPSEPPATTSVPAPRPATPATQTPPPKPASSAEPPSATKPEAPTPSGTAATAAAGSSSTPSPATGTTEPAAKPTEGTATSAPSATEETPKARPPAEPAAPEPSLPLPERRSSSDTWLIPALVIIGALVLFGLIWRLARRPRSPGDDFKGADTATLASGPVAKPATPVARAVIEPAPERREEVAAAPRPVMPPPPREEPPLRAPTPEVAKPTAPAPPPATPGFSPTDTRQIDLEGGDTMAEADFHLAYGLYDEAILLLTQSLVRDPARTDIGIKLAEAYFSANRAQDFMGIAKTLRGQLDGAEWERVAVLGHQLFPEDPLFGGKTSGAGSSQPAKAAPAKSAPSAAGVIAFDAPAVETKPASAPPKASAPAGNEIAFTLDSDMSPAVGTAAGDAGGVDLESRLNLDDPALGGDEAMTKLDLARAYIDLGDNEMARGLLSEVMQQGSNEQRTTAEDLMRKLPA